MTNLAQIEALLFISGDQGISLGDLSRVTGFMKPAVLEILQQLADKYAQDPDCALVLLNAGQTYRLATKPDLAPLMKHYFEVPLTVPLTNALLEVLAIVAYKQPLTRIEIDDIRGVQSSGSLQKLTVRGLVKTAGRLDAPGRPFQYVTTDKFLDYFGLQSLADLPPLSKEELPDNLADYDSDIFLQALKRRQKQQKGD
ncbi:SMC-Scp complex subunit ScpB [Limosilactobacillus difficilis]|uniref:SMC-Scp complex subunit ScpB n=1 Tax=Limosilactobacillus difficilis TaxID=2991838 RepID=UPI0024B8FF2A|nr:SMC-Scp complex subunit ScpB [Limosilactobacillus difficilis]